jgi:serine protease Do
LDGQVARREDKELNALLDHYVCVRIVQGYGLDLSLFQYDNQLTWSVFFLNADRTIYGRYGTRSGQDAATDVSMEGFQKSAEAALKLHAQYAAVKPALAAKTGPAPRWATPEEIPSLSSYKKGDTSRQGCIHCHKIHTGILTTKRDLGEALSDADLWDFPLPDVIGLSMDANEVARVARVIPNSPAAAAGFEAQDDIAEIDGQPIVSPADIQWVLQNTNAAGTLSARVLRGGASKTLNVKLKEGWRRAGNFEKKAISWALGQRILGFRSTLCTPEEREKLGALPGPMALRVTNIVPDWLKTGNHPARKSGLVKNDIVVAADGRSDFASESQFLAYVFQERKAGEMLKLDVRRNEKSLTIEFPVGK